VETDLAGQEERGARADEGVFTIGVLQDERWSKQRHTSRRRKMQEHTDGERRGKDLIGMPVITIQEGRKLGEVTALWIRRENTTVAAVRIGSHLGPGPAVPFGNLRLVGIDAILVDSAAALEPALPTEALRELDDAVIGRAVLTASGERIGTVSGFWVNTVDGRIAAYRVHPEAGLLSRLANLLRNDTFEVLAEQVQALGAAALIVMDNVANVGNAGT
jgi:sporulation protein YlmC with PRC-barrel domain